MNLFLIKDVMNAHIEIVKGTKPIANNADLVFNENFYSIKSSLLKNLISSPFAFTLV